MSAASDYLEVAVLDHVLGNATFTQPTDLYLGLFTNTSSNADANLESGVLTDEVSGGGYAREIITFDNATSPDGSADSASTVTFPAATANWGEVTHVAVMDAATGGNVLFYGAVTTPKTIESGDTFQVSAGNLTISLA